MLGNPRVRQTLYILGTIATSLISLAAMWKGISGETASALSNAITAIAGLLGVGATATATAAVTKQQRDGTFSQQMSPVEQAINGIQATVDQVNTAASDFERVKEAASNVLNNIPVVGPLAKQVIDSAKLP